MFRSLHMKLMLIMTLLIISLMTVVGAFLINSVANYYTQDFYTDVRGLWRPGLLEGSGDSHRG